MEKNIPILLEQKPSDIKADTSVPKKRKINWKRLITYENLANNLNERIRFILTFLTISITVIFVGDLFKHLTFNVTGVMMIIIGILGIIATCVIPIIAYSEKNGSHY